MNAKTILIVDDNPTNLKLASYVLEGAEFSVLVANGADNAREVLKGSRPDLILLDIQMPGMDGLSLTRLLKSDPANRGILIVALTSFAMKGDEAKALAAGCDAYITKPIDTASLPLKISEMLRAVRST